MIDYRTFFIGEYRDKIRRLSVEKNRLKLILAEAEDTSKTNVISEAKSQLQEIDKNLNYFTEKLDAIEKSR